MSWTGPESRQTGGRHAADPTSGPPAQPPSGGTGEQGRVYRSSHAYREPAPPPVPPPPPPPPPPRWNRPAQGTLYGYRRDPDMTIVMPVVPSDSTMVMPVYQAAGPTQTFYPPPPGPPAPPGEEEEGGSVARNSAIMAIGSLVSRFTGAIRTIALGAAIGAGGVADAYNLANTFPNMVYELLLGGVLASVVVPLLVRARKRDRDQGEAYAQRLLSMATAFLAGATVLAVAIAPVLTFLIAGSSPAPTRHLITTFSYLLLPEILFYGVAALLSAVLNTRGHFAAPMWTPILNNVIVVITAGIFIALPHTGVPTPENVGTAQVLVLGVGTTLGIVVQAAGLFPALRKVGFKWRWRGQWRELGLRELSRIGGWMLTYVIVSQIALFVVLRLAQSASNRGGPGPAIWNNAYLIFAMAHGIVAVSIITALMPRMSAAAADRRYQDVTAQLSLGTRLTAVILVPATAALIIFGRQLAVTLFQWHNYYHTQAIDTGWVIAAAATGLVPFAISQMQIFAFYALPDTKTPALINIPVAAARIAVNLILWAILPATWLVAGLMLGNTVSYVLACAVGYRQLRARLGPLGMTAMISTLSRLGTAALIAAVPTLLVTLILEGFLGLGHIGSAVQLVVGGVVLIVVYLAAAVGLRVREVNEVWGMVRGRLGR